MQKIKNVILSTFNTLSIIGLIAGGIGGYLYYYFIGCNSGSCPIQSNPLLSIIWGALLGYLLFDMFNVKKKAKEENTEE